VEKLPNEEDEERLYPGENWETEGWKIWEEEVTELAAPEGEVEAESPERAGAEGEGAEDGEDEELGAGGVEGEGEEDGDGAPTPPPGKSWLSLSLRALLNSCNKRNLV